MNVSCTLATFNFGSYAMTDLLYTCTSVMPHYNTS